MATCGGVCVYVWVESNSGNGSWKAAASGCGTGCKCPGPPLGGQTGDVAVVPCVDDNTQLSLDGTLGALSISNVGIIDPNGTNLPPLESGSSPKGFKFHCKPLAGVLAKNL